MAKLLWRTICGTKIPILMPYLCICVFYTRALQLGPISALPGWNLHSHRLSLYKPDQNSWTWSSAKLVIGLGIHFCGQPGRANSVLCRAKRCGCKIGSIAEPYTKVSVREKACIPVPKDCSCLYVGWKCFKILIHSEITYTESKNSQLNCLRTVPQLIIQSVIILDWSVNNSLPWNFGFSGFSLVRI